MATLLGDIGTIEWCRRTRGLMTAGERMRYMTAVLLETSRSLPRLLLSRAGVWRRGPDPSSFKLPDTAFAREVLAVCAQLSPMLTEHSLRSYLFARALAAVDGEHVDDEALFAATMLHDCAFPEVDDPSDDRCFGLRGAERAEALLQRAPFDSATRHAVLDAITLHLNPYVSAEQGALQRLTHNGVMLDVVGIRAWELDRAGIDRVNGAHPRHAFLHIGFQGFVAHGARLPRTRAAAAVRCGFGMARRIGPFFELEARSRQLGPNAGVS